MGAIVAAGVFAFLVHRALSKKDVPDVVLRSVEEAVPPSDDSGPQHPYRARLRNVVMRMVPRVSGTQTTAVVLASLVVCAVLFPATLHLPRWVEFEVVLVAWWLVMSGALAWLLYKGLRIADDFRLTLKRPGADPKTSAAAQTSKPKKSGSWLDPSGCADPGGCTDAEGCVGVLVVGIAVVAAVGVAWLVAELIVPVFFAACYVLLTRALARVANDKHDCAGRLGPAIRWGMTWAALYVAPLAAIVWAVHAAWKLRG
jgi:hypothetical protein